MIHLPLLNKLLRPLLLFPLILNLLVLNLGHLRTLRLHRLVFPLKILRIKHLCFGLLISNLLFLHFFSVSHNLGQWSFYEN